MKKIFLVLILIIGFINPTFAQNDTRNTIKPMAEHAIKKMDRKLTKHKALKRNFSTKQEFKRNKQRRMMRNNKHITSKSMRNHTNRYNNGYDYTPTGYRDDYRPIRQRGYGLAKQGWILAYRYDRASFYDNEGFFYGYFNRYGYYFEDVFYSYDRYYTYRDRVRGRGLFNRSYYMPANANYYGFCDTPYNGGRYERGYNNRY